MSDTQPVTVATYTSANDTTIARLALEQAGISCKVTGGELDSSLSWYGSAVTKLDVVVSQADVPAAVEVLREAEQQMRPTTPDPWDNTRHLGWVCVQCAEVNTQQFDECWKCAAGRPENPELAPLPDLEDESTASDSEEVLPEQALSTSPYRTPLAASNGRAVAVDSDLERRIFRAAILSVCFLPLAFYASWLVIQGLNSGRLSSRVWWIAVPLILVFSMSALIVAVEFIPR